MNRVERRLSLSALVASIVLLAPSWALAGDANCLWSSLSNTKKDQLLVAYERGGSTAVAGAGIDMTEQMVRTCGNLELLRRDSAMAGEAMGMALQGYAVEKGLERVITARRGIPAASLDRAWRNLTEDQRAALRRAAPPQNQVSQEALDAMFAAIRGTGWSGARSDWFDDPNSKEVSEYFLARALRESAESRF